MTTIFFSTETHYTGRNGTGKMIGIELMKTENGIILQPINSKAQTANCSMKIPNEEIPALIEELKKYNL